MLEADPRRSYKNMRKRMLIVVATGLLMLVGYIAGVHNASVAHAGAPVRGVVPKSYGKLVTAIPDSIGTGLVFEDAKGVIRFVSVNGMKEGELARYDQTPTRGGIPKSYGRLVTAVVNHGTTGLIFEDAEGVIRFVTLTGVTERELARN
jgi:hypothetical protein